MSPKLKKVLDELETELMALEIPDELGHHLRVCVTELEELCNEVPDREAE